MRRHYARYGPADRYERPPPAGLCLSVFALLEQRGKVLVGRSAPHPRWMGDWLPQLKAYDAADRAESYRWLRLPGCYLREGEHPERALARVLRSQLRARTWRVEDLHVGSWTAPSDRYPGEKHWDLAFTYRVRARVPAPGPWWAELAWRDPRELRARDFGWSDDFARALGVAR